MPGPADRRAADCNRCWCGVQPTAQASNTTARDWRGSANVPEVPRQAWSLRAETSHMPGRSRRTAGPRHSIDSPAESVPPRTDPHPVTFRPNEMLGHRMYVTGSVSSKSVGEGKLQDSRRIEGIDRLQCAEAAGASLGDQVTGLIDGLPIPAIWAVGRILKLVHSRAILHVIVGVVE